MRSPESDQFPIIAFDEGMHRPSPTRLFVDVYRKLAPELENAFESYIRKSIANSGFTGRGRNV